MKALRLFIDTHDRNRKTFPGEISLEQFEGFFAKYVAACAEEGVVPVRTHVGFAGGRAFCLNLAPDAEAVRRAHARVGLPFDDITEVVTASPDEAFLQR